MRMYAIPQTENVTIGARREAIPVEQTNDMTLFMDGFEPGYWDSCDASVGPNTHVHRQALAGIEQGDNAQIVRLSIDDEKTFANATVYNTPCNTAYLSWGDNGTRNVVKMMEQEPRLGKPPARLTDRTGSWEPVLYFTRGENNEPWKGYKIPDNTMTVAFANQAQKQSEGGYK